MVARAARPKVGVARRRLILTIAMLASPIGWPNGLLPRRLGAVRTGVRAAPRQLEVALESENGGRSWPWCWPMGHLLVPMAWSTGSICLCEQRSSLRWRLRHLPALNAYAWLSPEPI